MIDLQIHAEHGLASLTDPDNPLGMPAIETSGPTNRAAILALIDKIDIPEDFDRTTAFHIEMVGNRFWIEDGTLLCAPINVDGTVDWDNAGEPEATAPEAEKALTHALILLEADSKNW